MQLDDGTSMGTSVNGINVIKICTDLMVCMDFIFDAIIRNVQYEVLQGLNWGNPLQS